jgi:hypothetical protein
VLLLVHAAEGNEALAAEKAVGATNEVKVKTLVGSIGEYEVARKPS